MRIERRREDLRPDPRRHAVVYCGETVTSFAQNCEDVLFYRAFRGTSGGSFIDVGAGHPIADNVTCWLYTKGWRGINIEPNPEFYAALCAYRPDDININVGISTEDASLDFYKIHQNDLGHGWGLSSFDPACLAIAHEQGLAASVITVPVAPLASIVETNGLHAVDLLKVDVEGLERAVLDSADWSRFAPRLICIEAVMPNSAQPAWPQWEEILSRQDYSFALFDGVNCFYCKSGDDDMLGQLTAPVCCNDVYRKADSHDMQSLHETLRPR